MHCSSLCHMPLLKCRSEKHNACDCPAGPLRAPGGIQYVDLASSGLLEREPGTRTRTEKGNNHNKEALIDSQNSSMIHHLILIRNKKTKQK